jgi:hypothetical protein
MSGGQITPLVWSSRSLSVWLPRSCSVQAFESVFCAQADETVLIVIKRAANAFFDLAHREGNRQENARFRNRSVEELATDFQFFLSPPL